MASPIDPETLAKLQAQGWLDAPAPPAPKAAFESHEAPPPNFSMPGSERENAIRAELTRPITPRPDMAPGGRPRAEGVFSDAPGGGAPGEAPAPQWKMPPTHAVAGKWAPTASPGVVHEYNTALAAKQEAPTEVAGAQVQGDERMARLYDTQAKAVGEQMLQQDAARRKRTEALDAQMADYKRLQDEAANQKEDPGRWWGSKSAGEKMLGVIGIIFGGLSQGQGHGNPAMDLMNRSIDQDIAAQKANIAQKSKKAEAAYNIYAQKLKQFGDTDAADMATKAQMQEQFKLQMMAEAARSGSPVRMAQAKEQAAAIQLEQAKEHRGLEAWQKGGVAGGITEADQKRAFELYKSGMVDPKTGHPIEMNQALQAALALRGVAPMQGLPTLGKAGSGKGGKADKEELAATRLEESSKSAPESLGAWDRVTAGLSHLPGAGVLFQGTEGARKEQAIGASNVPIYGYAHVGLGMRRTEDMEHAAGALMIQPKDSQARINQKMALRALVARGQMNAIDAAKKIGGGVDSGPSEKSSSDDEE